MANARSGNGEEVTETLRHAAAELGRDLSRTAHDAREAAKELAAAIGEAATERTQDASRTLVRSMRHHPMAWLTAAADAGVLVTLLATQRHGGR